jgi:predicted Zn-dependent protease
MMAQLREPMTPVQRRYHEVVAVVDRDLFGPNTSFVFSWQGRADRGGIGVLSTYRFVEGLPDYYEPAIVATRRVAIQALSTTSRMFGFCRSTDPQCPTAYPESLHEFLQKRPRLSESEEQQRDELLASRGGTAELFGPARSAAIARVYRAYQVE